MSNHRVAPTIAGVAVIIAAVSGLMWYRQQHGWSGDALRQTDSATLSPAVNERVGDGEAAARGSWLSYSDERFGLSFQYPNGWYPYQDHSLYPNSVFLLKTPNPEIPENTELYALGEQIRVSIGSLDVNGRRRTPEEYVAEIISDSEVFLGSGIETILAKEWVEVNGIRAYRIEQYGAGVSRRELQYLFFDDSEVYSFFLYPLPQEPLQETNEREEQLAQNLRDFEQLVRKVQFE